jgi:hypothetical protein
MSNIANGIQHNGRPAPLPVPAPRWVRVIAHVLSYIFHPVFIPLYVTWFLLYVHPGYTNGFSSVKRLRTLLTVTQNAVFYPLFCVLLLKGVGFIDSIYLRTRKDRIIPYIASGIFYFWTFTVLKEQEVYPRIFPSFMLGVFLASSAALIANIYYKISMHAIGLGGMLGLFIIVAWSNSMLMTWPLSAALLITGAVCSARLLISDHTNKDIYSGLAIGLIMQFVAAFIML